MKKLHNVVALTALTASLLTGCSMSSSVNVAADGAFSADITVSLSKQLLTKTQWNQMLQESTPGGLNDLPPGATCSDTSDSDNWKYGCAFTGTLTDPQFDDLFAGDSMGVSVTRVGTSVQVTAAQPQGATDEDSGFGGLTVTTSVSMPGTVQTPLPACATAGADVKSVTMTMDGDVPCVVGYTLDTQPGAATTTSLSATPNGTAKKMTLRARPVDVAQNAVKGTVQFYEGETLLGTAPVTGGVATLTKSVKIGEHALRAVYIPSNFWRLDQSEASTALAVVGFDMRKAPSLTGKAKVGSTLKAVAGNWSPSPTKLTYQWVRNGKAIARATQPSYTLTKSDKGKKIAVIVSVSKPGYQSISKLSAAVSVK